MRQAAAGGARRHQTWLCTLCVMVAWVAANVDAEAAPVADLELGEGAETDEAKGRGDYSKKSKVPEELTVSRKLVTASWLRCKLACDGDKSCSGFKFTPMKNKQLPMCEILAMAAGDYVKGAVNATAGPSRPAKQPFESRASISRKYAKAKELVAKAEQTHLKTSAYAEDMRKKLLAVQKQIHSGKAQIQKMQEKESGAKKRVHSAHAMVKKAKEEVKMLEGKEETVANRKGQEIRAKAGKSVSQVEREAMDIISKRAKTVGREEGSFKSTVQAVTAKETLVKHLCKKNMQVLRLKKKVIAAELELKYKDAPEELLKAKAKIDEQLRSEKNKLKSSERLSKKYGGHERKEKDKLQKDKEKADSLSKAMVGSDLVKTKQLDELEQESKGFQKDQGLLKADAEKLTRYRKKMRELEQKHDKSSTEASRQKRAEKHTKKTMSEKLQKEKWKAMAGAAESRKTLMMLHQSLTERRKSLEADVTRLRTMVKLNGESRTELLTEFQKMSFEEQHLEHEIGMLQDVKKKTKQLHDRYMKRIKQIKDFGGTIWLKKHNVQNAIAKFRSDIISLGAYTDKAVKVSDAEHESKIEEYMINLDKRKEDLLDDVAKQSAKKAEEIINDQLAVNKKNIRAIKEPGAMVMAYQALLDKKAKLKKEVTALKTNAPSFNELVSGEFHALSQYTDRKAVVRMLARLNKQYKGVMNSTAIEKKKSILQVSQAAARLYAHQIAHATHDKYLKFKLGRLDKRMRRIKSDVRQLKRKQNLPSKRPGADEYDHLLNDEKVNPKNAGSSVESFTMQTSSWLNPEPVAVPAEVTKKMRDGMRNALKTQFSEIADQSKEVPKDIKQPGGKGAVGGKGERNAIETDTDVRELSDA